MDQPCETRATQGAGASPAGPGLARLAGRISAWTTRGVLSAMILVIGLGFGRQVIVWWADDRSERSAASEASEADSKAPPPPDPAPYRLELGDKDWTILQQQAAGSRAQASAALRARCRQITAQAPLPADDAGPAERRFLETIAGRRPVDEAPGQWQLFEIDGPFLLVAGTRFRGGAEADAGRRVAPPECRVVTWGMAVPHGPQGWTLYAFHAAAPSTEPLGAAPEIPLPPDSRKTLSVQVPGGLGAIHFTGPGEAEAWKGHFDSWFSTNGWSAAGWRRHGALWQCRFSRGPGGQAAPVEVQLGSNGAGALAGLLLTNPRESTRR